jgi:ribonuclease HI
MVVEAMAIVWALELALSEKFAKVIVESDAKMCIENLSYPTDASCWKIRNFSVRIVDLISGFVSCNVQWVCREGNQVAHSLAKAAFSLALPFCCSLDTLPPSVEEAWFRDVVLFAL